LQGWAAADASRGLEAAQYFERVRRERPGDLSAALGLLYVRRGTADADALGLDARSRALIAGWRANTAEDWEALRAQDAALAEWLPGDLLFPEAARLRAQWRISLPGAELASEAFDLLEPLLRRSTASADLLLFATAATRAGRSDDAWATIDRLARSLRSRDVREWARVSELARELPEHPRVKPLRTQLDTLNPKAERQGAHAAP
jgi:hypothetical protein